MTIGPYETFEELGRGGMGVVYRARHAALGHEVALKVIRPDASDDPEMLARFRREALAAARVSGHPNVVAVHDVGEAFVASDATNALTDPRRAAPGVVDQGAAHVAGPVLYLAMPLVRGRSLDRLIDDDVVTPASAAAVLAGAARGLHHAHGLGVLHRDVKPHNILVTAEGLARVTDFGLARVQAADLAVTRLTRTGYVVGTPAYLAPEQARGEACGPAADVWGLGATLYECLAGRPPFGTGSMAAVLGRVLREPPEALPASAAAPAALVAIAQACLAKDPAGRPASAAAVADALEAFGRGESPVQALGLRRPGWVARLRRRPAAAALALALVAGTGLAAGLGAWHWRAQATGAAEIAGTAEGARLATRAGTVAAAYQALVLRVLAPLRRLEGRWADGTPPAAEDAAALATIEAEVRAVEALHPGTVAPAALGACAAVFAGHTAEGRARLARAAAAVPEDPFPDLCRAWLDLASYARSLAPPRLVYDSASGPTLAPFSERAAESAARVAAGSALRGLRDQAVWAALPQGADLLAFAAGAELLARDDFAGAAERLGPAGEHPLIGGAARRLRAIALAVAGRRVEAAAEWERLAEAGSARARHEAAAAWLAEGTALHSVGADARDALDRALRHFDLVVAAKPDWTAVRAERASAWRAHGVATAARGGDAAASFARGLLDADAAVARAPDDPAIRCQRGYFHQDLAEVARAGGADARGHYRRALDDYEAALTADPGYRHARNNRGNTWASLGQLERSEGGDAAACFRRSIDDLDVLVRDDPTDASVLANRAGSWRELAEVEAAAGRDPEAAFEQALADAGRVIAADPSDAPARIARGNTWWARGQHAADDPTPHYRRALEDFDVAVAASPSLATGRLGRAMARVSLGMARADAGEDPRDDFAAAIADADVAVAANPRDATARTRRGVARLELARARGEAGEDPAPEWAAAFADLDAALAVNDRDIEARSARGAGYFQRAQSAPADRDPLADLDHAIADFTALLARDPTDPLGRMNRGFAWRERGRLRAARGEDPADDYAAALTDFDALEAAGRGPRGLAFERAALHCLAAASAGGERRAEHFGQALRALDQAVAEAPGRIPAHLLRGRVLASLGRRAEAAAAYAAVLRLAPDHPEARARVAALAAGER